LREELRRELLLNSNSSSSSSRPFPTSNKQDAPAPAQEEEAIATATPAHNTPPPVINTPIGNGTVLPMAGVFLRVGVVIEPPLTFRRNHSDGKPPSNGDYGGEE